MIVSWEWLREYVNVDATVDAVAERLTMTGLNLEEIQRNGDNIAIDLEVTSNRPDCLGHIGIAREVGVLFKKPLAIPEPSPKPTAEKTASATSVTIEAPELCPLYIARVIRGVKVGPSPDWLRRRLETVGIPSINNVVDITNYVLMECGQPLHAFDFDKLHGKKIVVRRAKAGEKLVAINQREYPLTADMCVIADADHPVALAGVMGGLETEIGNRTVNVLVEAADFAPLSVRNTARKLSLHSASSYRFERGVDRTKVEWASRRCCELILKLAGGELLDEPVVAGAIPDGKREPIRLRFAQIRRILGIDVAADEAVLILESLGLRSHGKRTSDAAEFIPPTWRRDLEREIDLIEEIARIHGYEKIPADVDVPLQLSNRTKHDRVVGIVRETLIASGFFEAMTLSFVSDEQRRMFLPRGEKAELFVEHSSRRHENVLRQSLIPSLLQCRRENERQGTFDAQLFEVAKVYLEAAPGRPERDVEPKVIGLVTGHSFNDLKGVLQSLVKRINGHAEFDVRPSDAAQFVPGRGAEVLLNGVRLGWLGELDRSVTDQLDLRDAVTVAELDLAILEDVAELVPTYTLLPQFPGVERDLNFVLNEEASWAELEQIARKAAGTLLDRVEFGGQYRGKQIGVDKKSYVIRLHYRSPERTLTSDEVEAAQEKVIAAATKELGAELR